MTTHMAGAINVVHDYDEVIPAVYYGSMSSSATTNDDRLPNEEEEEVGLRKGPWTLEEDSVLINYVNTHGEGRWNSLARHAGLKRNGKSCRLRWLNYLRPCVRRGNITLQEQLLILQLHSRWGNRWSKIAEYLPGRTDNEVKNYWRTRVQKQAKHLKCDVNSKQFQDAMRCVWIPRLMERIHSSSQSLSPGQPSTNQTTHGVIMTAPETQYWVDPHLVPKTSGATSSDESSDQLHDHQVPSIAGPTTSTGRYGDGSGYDQMSGLQSDVEAYEESNNLWSSIGGDSSSVENWWNEENIWFLQQQLSDDS